MEDKDYHSDEDEVDSFSRQPAHQALLSSLMAYAPQGTFSAKKGIIMM